jgi:ketosteroid isomerase-like protein
MIDTPNARTEANRQTIRQAFNTWQQGTGPITDVFAPDMLWRIEGHSLASKEYRSRQQFIDEVLTPFGATPASSALPPDHDPLDPRRRRHRDRLLDGRGIANNGQPYENSYAWFMTMRDGKVIDGTAFYDSISFNDLWTRVQPRS